MQTNPPEGMPQICPYLYYEDVEAALRWLTKSFGFREKVCMRGPEGALMHAEIQLGRGVVFLGPGMEPFGTTRVHDPMSVHAGLYVFVDDIDTHFATAKASGATIISDIQEMLWGDKMYVTQDLEGQRWIFAEHVKDV